MTACTLAKARATKRRAHSTFAALADVVGVGITRRGEGYALKVNLRSAPASGVTLPEDVNGVPVHVEVVGTLTKRAPK